VTDNLRIYTEEEYNARLEQLDALVDCVLEYEARMCPIEGPTFWWRVRSRWDQAWRQKVFPALIGLLLGILIALVLLPRISG